MKIWWLLLTENYYPGIDNFEASFETREEALEYLNSDEFISKYDEKYMHYKIFNVSDRLGLEEEEHGDRNIWGEWS